MTSLRILLIADEGLLGLLLGEVLEGMGHFVCGIESTETDAVATAARCKADMILADIQLDKGSGVSAVEQILRQGFVPHVFYSDDISGVQATQPSAVAIQKPFRIPDLARAFERALGVPVSL